MNLQGQTINDRLLAARHSLAGQGLAKSVCKATTEELIGPKKKHLDYLVHCTNEPNVSIPHLANLLIERSQNANWIVVYKALLTTHHLLAYGNERFMQYLASSNSSFNLNNFLDKGGVQGAPNARIGYDMSPFIRRYAKYLNDKALSYRTVAFDFCKVKRGKEEGSLRTMNADKLLKTLPVLQAQLDSLLEFDCQSNDLTNSVINMCFMLLFRDLIRLFACYNDGIINLLEKYFDMNKKQARDALDLYKRFLVRMDKVGEFLKVAENVGIDKGDIPDLTKAPSSLLDALEQHLATLEGRKGSAANTPTQSASNQKYVKSGVNALSSTSSSFGTAVASTKFDSGTNGIDDAIKAQALAEEEAAMNQYKSKVASPTSSNQITNNPFLSTPPASQANTNIVDLFGGDGAGGSAVSAKASDDLLQLGNPFADMFGGPGPQSVGGGAPAPVQGANNIWMSNGFNGSVAQQSNTFVSDSNFSSVFGNSEPSAVTDLTTNSTLPNPFFDSDDNQIFPTGVINSTQPQYQLQHENHQQPSVSFQQTGDISEHEFNKRIRSPPDGSASLRKQSAATGTVIVASALNNNSIIVNQSINKTAFQELNDSIRFAMGSPRRPSLAEIRAESIEASIVAAANTTIDNIVPKTVDLYSNQELSSIQESMDIIAGYNKNIIVVDGSQMQSAFQAPNIGGFDALGDVLKPASSMMGSGGQQLLQQHHQQNQQQLFQTGNVLVTGAAQGQQQNNQSGGGGGGGSQPAQPGKIITGDLDSSLASLVDNLNMTKSGSTKGVNWNSPKNTAKPGNNWSPQPMAATTGAGYRPMAQGMTVSPAPITLNHQFIHASYPVIPNYIQQGMPMMGGQQMMPAGMMQQTVAPGITPQMMQQQSTNPTAQNGKPADPFGAI